MPDQNTITIGTLGEADPYDLEKPLAFKMKNTSFGGFHFYVARADPSRLDDLGLSIEDTKGFSYYAIFMEGSVTSDDISPFAIPARTIDTEENTAGVPTHFTFKAFTAACSEPSPRVSGESMSADDQTTADAENTPSYAPAGANNTKKTLQESRLGEILYNLSLQTSTTPWTVNRKFTKEYLSHRGGSFMGIPNVPEPYVGIKNDYTTQDGLPVGAMIIRFPDAASFEWPKNEEDIPQTCRDLVAPQPYGIPWNKDAIKWVE